MKSSIRGGDCGDYDYGCDDRTTLNKLAHYNNSLLTQATRKLTSPSAVQFVQGYRLE